MKKNKNIDKDKLKKRQIVIYLEEDELEYLDYIYNKKFFPTRAVYIRMLINEDKEMNGY
ncbi:Uncharacterised protein [Campylobacter hyointestinalis]|uniref:hypothetical protein n=1 Tax=Campylobacter TaxID=194 RepID=UPI00072ADC85|nr:MULTISPECIES: hypothetical protein [Campylobacter]QMS68042.1 hypothetical protein GZ984_006130 [Campylobacter fetus]CUU92124.1 Uncharacterised protein [Campylobacter hyointestinalis]HDX8136817.1 hypothetical protein [Campylobacter fetus]HDX8138030.1 hypothetical protein [Campylobacter fetus]HDX8143868.1 hypothetical protein [Campylobacter fetus]